MMYEYVHAVFADKKGGEIFTCFGAWHFAYMIFFFALFFAVYAFTRKKNSETKKKVTDFFINIAFAILILDFFFMPLAYGEIDIEKLPFHVCTAMCVMCFLSRHLKVLAPLRIHFVLLGFISNLVYLIYPAGVMWHAVGPLSYRVIETLTYHGVMTVFGLLAITYEGEELRLKNWYKSLFVLVGMTLWALLGNTLYNGTSGDYSHFFNWFFVVEDPFGMIDSRISPYIMPILNIAVFFAVEMIVYAVRRAASEKRSTQRDA